jgi:two-component system chemotaxis sensor kinase CheA
MQLSDLQKQLLGSFFEESAEGLDRLEAGLLELDANSGEELINELFRVAHNMKGGAGTFGLAEVTELGHAMETVLDGVRQGTLSASAEVTRLLLESVDACRSLLSDAKAGKPLAASSTEGLRARLAAVVVTGAGASGEPGARGKAAEATRRTFEIHFAPRPGILDTGNEPLRILRELKQLGDARIEADCSDLPALSDIDPALVYLAWQVTLVTDASEAQVREVFAWVEGDAEIEIQERQAQPKTPAEDAAGPPVADARSHEVGGHGSIRVAVDKIDLLMNMVGELVITQSMLGELDADGAVDAKRLQRLRQGLTLLARNTRSIQESVMRLRSMPISVIFNRFPRLAHDLSAKLGKQVELEISGETTEIDKTVLEKIGDPLVHLVRNALDHGLELPEERVAAGKSGTGTLRLDAYHQGGDIVIRVADDGRGIDRERVLRRAREVGLVRPDEEPSEDFVKNLIFAPGFSTAAAVTDVSGRGVGMDVVREGVKSLGGDVSVASTLGKGTCVSLRLPLTLAIIDGQLVRIGRYLYVVPLLSIVESVEIDPRRVSPYEHGARLYRLRDDFIPMINPATLLGAGDDGIGEQKLMVVVEADNERIGLLVDELLAQQQVVVKSLEANYGRVEGLAGATVIGEGSVSLILDVAGISRIARERRSEQAA